MITKGIVRNGVVVLESGSLLPEGMEVVVQPVSSTADVVSETMPQYRSDEGLKEISVEVSSDQLPISREPDGKEQSFAERFKEFVGVIKDLPDDGSLNHDHYLYGTPKR